MRSLKMDTVTVSDIEIESTPCTPGSIGYDMWSRWHEWMRQHRGKSISQICKETQVQMCDSCEDTNCGDNMNWSLREKKANERTIND